MGAIGSMLNSGNEHIVKQSEIDAARIKQEASNKLSASKTALAQSSQAITNKYIMEASARKFESAGREIIALSEQASKGKMFSRIEASEMLGAAAAGAAAAGVGGASADSYANGVKLAQAIREEAGDRNVSQSVFNMTSNQYEYMQQGVEAQQQDLFFADIDYTKYLDHKREKVTIGQLGVIAAATYFGGPQAGIQANEAMGQISKANYYNANAQFAHGNQALSNAVGSGAKAFTTARTNMEASGGSWGSSFFKGSGSSSSGGSGVELYGIKV